MSGRLDDSIEGNLLHRLHHEPGRLGLLTGEGYATAMSVLASCMSRPGVCVIVMRLFTMPMRCVVMSMSFV